MFLARLMAIRSTINSAGPVTRLQLEVDEIVDDIEWLTGHLGEDVWVTLSTGEPPPQSQQQQLQFDGTERARV